MTDKEVSRVHHGVGRLIAEMVHHDTYERWKVMTEADIVTHATRHGLDIEDYRAIRDIVLMAGALAFEDEGPTDKMRHALKQITETEPNCGKGETYQCALERAQGIAKAAM